MINIHELESRWLRYKIKSYLPYLFVSLTVVVAGSLFLYFNNTPTLLATNPTPVKKEITKTPAKTTLKQEIAVVEPIIEEKNIPQALPTQQTTKLSLEPSFDFIENIQDNSPRYYTETVKEPVVVQTKKAVQKKKKTVVAQENKTAKKPQEQVVATNTTMTIDRKNTQDDIDHVLARFKKSNNPALSLFAAKKYYELEDYKQAYNYALITNGINSNIDQSWIIFAKSMVKMGEKNKAISVLKKYIAKSNSSSAKILLKNITAGKI